MRWVLFFAAGLMMADAASWIIKLATGGPGESRSVQLTLAGAVLTGGLCALALARRI